MGQGRRESGDRSGHLEGRGPARREQDGETAGVNLKKSKYLYEHVVAKLPVCMITKKLIKESCRSDTHTKKQTTVRSQ